jgi:hypothetical protein
MKPDLTTDSQKNNGKTSHINGDNTVNEEEGQRFVSIGMVAAYSDMADKLARKLQMLEKAKVMFPQHTDYYDFIHSVIEIISDEHTYAQNMARVGREMHGETPQ